MTRGRQVEIKRERLYRLYKHSGMTMKQVASVVGCSPSAVSNALDRHGIKKNSRRKKFVNLNNREDGYVVWKTEDGQISVHQLTAIADGADPHTVFDDDIVVHHKNGVKWDNRPDNLDVVSIYEHSQIHAERGDLGRSRQFTDDELLSWIDSFVSEFGIVPVATDLRNWPGPSHEVYRQRFGGIREAIEETGYKPRGKK